MKKISINVVNGKSGLVENEKFFETENFIIQFPQIFIKNPKKFMKGGETDLEEVLVLLERDENASRISLTFSLSGAHSRWGHLHQKISVLIRSQGALYPREAFSVSKVVRCDGPGSRCSYDHGPWVEYLE